ncbi:anti-virulence regulator CigR family protein [Pseudomonas huanghezhanensis]|uniref:anti-virulence regulator CigR family protein n=1 Tax=Pseudomonas huanghezhanensis TaxID=3002903 RepID=UPI002285F1D6|nr:anti-virulence regulator CigR family protein [Pseudomonas sp. BSw22131]
MKVSNRLIAGLGIVMISATTLVNAAGPDQRDDHDNRGPANHQDQGRGSDRGNGQPGGNGPGNNQPQNNQPHPGQPGNDQRADNRGGGRPPANFDDVRRQVYEHREVIGRGQPLPPNVRIVRGHPLPRGYGKRLNSRSLQYLPRYDGYEWRRLGPDVVLIAIGSGIVYEILEGVLN